MMNIGAGGRGCGGGRRRGSAANNQTSFEVCSLLSPPTYGAEAPHPLRGGPALMNDRPGSEGPAGVRARGGTSDLCPQLSYCSESPERKEKALGDWRQVWVSAAGGGGPLLCGEGES